MDPRQAGREGGRNMHRTRVQAERVERISVYVYACLSVCVCVCVCVCLFVCVDILQRLSKGSSRKMCVSILITQILAELNQGKHQQSTHHKHPDTLHIVRISLVHTVDGQSFARVGMNGSLANIGISHLSTGAGFRSPTVLITHSCASDLDPQKRDTAAIATHLLSGLFATGAHGRVPVFFGQMAYVRVNQGDLSACPRGFLCRVKPSAWIRRLECLNAQCAVCFGLLKAKGARYCKFSRLVHQVAPPNERFSQQN